MIKESRAEGFHGRQRRLQVSESEAGLPLSAAFFGRIRAEVLYRETVGKEPLTPEEVAKEYNVPVEAVMEAIDYCVRNQDLLNAERAREDAENRAAGRDQWPYAPTVSGNA